MISFSGILFADSVSFVLSAVSMLRLLALSRAGVAATASGFRSIDEMIGLEMYQSRLMPVGVGGSGSTYCKNCMFYCPDISQLKEHMEICESATKDTQTVGIDFSAGNGGSPTDKEDETTSSLPVDLMRPYRCSRCGRSYQLAQSLQRHRWKCDQSRPMPCTICGAVYYRADNLQNHVKSAHVGGKIL